MKKIFLGIVLACSASGWAQFTPNLNLSLPANNTPNWGVALNNNFTLIDSNVMNNSTNQTIAGNKAFTGSDTFSVLNNVVMADQQAGATADAKIAAAIALLPSGGTVDARGFGCTAQTWANHVDIGSSTTEITLLLDRCTQFSVTVTGGVSAITVWSSSSIWAGGSANPQPATGGFNLSASANVSSIINFATGGSEPITGIHGITLRGNATATVTTAILDILNVTDQTTISDIVVWDFTSTIGIAIHTSGGIALGPINFNNISVNGQGDTGARPIKIYTSGAGVLGTVNFFGGSLTHPGSGGLPIVDIENTSAGLIDGVNFYGTQLENQNAADIGINCVNCTQVRGEGLLFTSATTAGTSCISITNSGGSTTDVTFDDITNFTGWTNTLANGINSHNVTDGRIAHYTYTDSTNGQTQGRTYLWSINQTAASQFAGTTSCLSGSKAISIPNGAFVNTPVILVFDETSGGSVHLSAKSASGFSVTCSGASDTFDWLVIGNPN